MHKTLLLWTAAVIITAGAAIYQRNTGPSYPVSGELNFFNHKIPFTLPRTNSCSTDLAIEINSGSIPLTGKVIWKRFKSSDKYSTSLMSKDNGVLKTFLPKQHPAGKLEYSVVLLDENNYEYFLTDDPVVMRFKGDVPDAILIPHIFAMFFALLLSTRTGLEFFNGTGNLKKLTFWTLGFLIAGGMILGPVTQLYAFGELWTGFPLGTDLTDNKILIALIGWFFAAVAVIKFKHPERWTLAASALLLIIFIIPHSLFGSEIDYTQLENESSEQIIIHK